MWSMPRFISPGLLRALVLGSLGLAHQACSSSDESKDIIPDGDADSSAGGGMSSTGGGTSSTGGGTSSTGGQRSSSGGNVGSGGDTAGTGGGDGKPDGSAVTWDDGGLVASKGCTDPVPLLTDVETGIYRCSQGYLHRMKAHQCENHLPRAGTVAVPTNMPSIFPTTRDDCSQDSDCSGPDAYCTVIDSAAYQCANAPRTYQRVCAHACRVDADCGAAAVCVCGSSLSVCVPVDGAVGCHADADCDGGLCLSNANEGQYGPAAFGCQLPTDECVSASDCASSAYCAMGPDGRSCVAKLGCGRPFLVAHSARVADVLRSDSWLATHDSGAMDVPAEPELCRLAAEHWTEIALMEHASIAAFARFTLQLLAIGAPADLIQDSTRAQADETRHARLAFQLAASYGGTAVGPSSLDLQGALDDLSVEQILRTTIAEGCIGEARAQRNTGSWTKRPSLASTLPRHGT